ncbi:MAG: hypothetical protein KDB53_21980, partial [Planctomycetes bacterium]|nr:hypothetical protein [Planctomycetota bacterium]
HSRRGGVARILGYNLRVGQIIPGTRGKIVEIHRDHLVVQVEDATTALYLPPPGEAQAKRNEDEDSKEPVESEDAREAPTPAARVPDDKNEASTDTDENGG